MLKGDWLRNASIGLAIVVAGFALWGGLNRWIIPDAPEFAVSQPLHIPDSGYRLGGDQCNPERLAQIRSAREREDQTAECADQANQHAHDQSDLEQQWRSANASEEMARLAQTQVRMSAVEAVIVFFALCAAGWAAWETRKAANLGQTALLLEQPPILTIEQVSVPIEAGHPKGEAFLVNRGSTTAHILRSELWVITYRTLPPEHPTRAERASAFPNLNLDAGQSRVWQFEENSVTLTEENVREIKQGALKIAVVGIVSYTGVALRRTHHTLFCRQYNPEARRYLPVSDPDYELSS